MNIENITLKKVLEKYRELSLLNKISGVMEWDLNVSLPPKGAEGRAAQTAYLSEISTNIWNDPAFKTLVDELIDQRSSLNPDEQAIVRNLERSGRYYWRVPKEVIIEKSRTSSESFMAWQAAKVADSFADFLPYLKKTIQLEQVIAQHLGFEKNPYDALLDLYEPNLTADFCTTTFSKLQPMLTKLLKKIQKSHYYQEQYDFFGPDKLYPKQSQRQLAMFALKKMGYDLEAGGVAVSAHPFTCVLGPKDVRFTVWFDEHDPRACFYAAMHEGGHALYEQGINPDFDQTPLEGGVSYAIHESQSRFWENEVGRDPLFISYMLPLFQAFFSEHLGKVSEETFIRFINQVQPSLIRVEADEVTYNLHIILRFELENELINGRLNPEDLPQAWNDKMMKFLGIAPMNNREGVLQDVHWSSGLFGYFPSYALGNLYAAQISQKLKKEVEFEDILRKGELGTILFWLREAIHQHGSLYLPDSLIQTTTQEPLNPKYFIQYLEEKYTKIYQL